MRSARVPPYRGRGAAPAVRWAALSLLAVLTLATLAQASPPVQIRFTGELGGLVSDVAGRPQPGAVVILFNKQERALQKTMTDALGAFAFPDLSPDMYSVHVMFSNFVPAIKERVLIKPGMRSLLEVNLSRVFSSVQLVSMAPVSGSLMSDSWKWALRADTAMRPILRFLPVQAIPAGSEVGTSGTALFADSRGMVRISASDGATVSSDGQADLGTQFAFATSLYKGNFLHLAGDVGYAPGSTAPSAAIRTTWSKELPTGDTPEISVTMRQVYIPLRMGQGVMANAQNGAGQADTQLPALRTLGVSFEDRKEISDSLQMEYGFAYDNVSFLDADHYFSPWARLTYAVPRGKVDFTWTSGNPRPELSMGTAAVSGSDDAAQSVDLQRELAAVDVLPRVTMWDGQARVERGDDFDLGFSQRFGSREFRISADHEAVSNTTLDLATATPGLFAGDLVPDLFSNSSLFNMGRFETLGYTASVTQDLGENYKVSVIYGSEGVLTPHRGQTTISDADDLRNIMTSANRPAVTVRVSGTLRATGTHIVASYQWTNYQSAVMLPMFSTESVRPEPGLNVIVRQPVPNFPGVPWRMEASAELTNLLAQGYLPLSTTSGNQFLLINTPRMLRGGLAFVF